MFYTILKHTHSGFRWLVLFLLLAAIFTAVIKLINKKSYATSDRKLGLFAMIFLHLQFISGLVLYFISGKVIFSAESMKSDMLRFFLVEHISMMLIAVVLFTIGYSKIKRQVDSRKQVKQTVIFYGLSLLIILLAIPWPWQNLAASWF